VSRRGAILKSVAEAGEGRGLSLIAIQAAHGFRTDAAERCLAHRKVTLATSTAVGYQWRERYDVTP